jgi:hypothetical protein
MCSPKPTKTPKTKRKLARPNSYSVLACTKVLCLFAKVSHSSAELPHFNCTIGIEVKGYLYLPLFFPNGFLPHSVSHQPVDKLSLSPPLKATQPPHWFLSDFHLWGCVWEWIREPYSKSITLRTLVLPLSCTLCSLLLEPGLWKDRGCRLEGGE